MSLYILNFKIKYEFNKSFYCFNCHFFELGSQSDRKCLQYVCAIFYATYLKFKS